MEVQTPPPFRNGGDVGLRRGQELMSGTFEKLGVTPTMYQNT